MLKKVKIARFKSVKLFERDLGNMTVLVGANNAGKSTILQAIHLGIAVAQSRRRLVDQSIDGTGSSFSIAPQQIIYTPMQDVLALGYGGTLTQTEGKHIQIDYEFANGHRGEIKLKKGRNRNLAITVTGPHVIGRIEDLSHPFSVYVPGLAGVAKQESYIARGQLLRAVARGDANLVLRNVLYALKLDAERWRKFTASLKEVFPDLGLHVAFDPESDEFIEVSISQGGFLPLDAAGTGVLQTIQILSYVYLFEPAVTLLDEPDAHLHPNNQRALAALLSKFADEGLTQVLLATHSRHVLDRLRESSETVWMRGGEIQTNTQHLNLLVDLGALDSAEGLLVKGVKYVFLTEDEKKNFLKTIVRSYNIPDNQFQIWSYKGSSKLDAAEALAAFIRDLSPTTKVIVHRDSDYLQPEDITRLKHQYSRANLAMFVTPGVDIEGLFCRIDHLKATNVGDETIVESSRAAALQISAAAMKAKAKEGAKQIDNYRYRHDIPTQGEEQREAWLTALDLTSERWIHGKILLANIRKEFQRQTGRNLKIFDPSDRLKFSELTEILQPTQTQTSGGAPSQSITISQPEATPSTTTVSTGVVGDEPVSSDPASPASSAHE